MNLAINDMEEFLKSVDEVEGHLCVLEGHSRPRYILTRSGESGYLGIDDFGQYWNKPVEETGMFDHLFGEAANAFDFDEVSTGTETTGTTGGVVDSAATFTDDDIGRILYNATTDTYATVTAKVSSTELTAAGVNFALNDVWELYDPIAHDALADEGQAWTVDEWDGFYLYNETAGWAAEILSNTADTLTYDKVSTGTETTGTTGGVVDSAATFTDDDIGRTLYNATTDTYAVVTARVSGTELTAAGVNFALDDVWELYETVTNDDEYHIANGLATGSAVNSVVDSGASWSNGEHIGKRLKNLTTGDSAPITGNGGTIITAAGVDATTGDAYQILDDGGSLNNEKYYSLMLVPVNRNITAAGAAIIGNGTLFAMPGQPEYDSGAVKFTLPSHDQKRVVDLGTASGGTSNTIVDDSKDWTADQFNDGHWARNVESDITADITDTTDDTLTATGVDGDDGERYQVLARTVTDFYVYAAEMDAASAITSHTEASFKLVDVIDASITEYILKTYSATATSPSSNHYQPPNGSFCKEIGGLLFVTGGITEERGTVTIDGVTETKTNVTVAIVDDDYEGSQTATIVRLTPSAAFTKAYVGSYITVTGSTDAENNLTDARVLRVADDMSWIEVANNSAVEVTSDASMSIELTENVLRGTNTYWSEGLVGAAVGIADDRHSGLSVAWVDYVNQLIGLGSKYDGAGATEAGYTIQSELGVYYSDFRNPHRFRAENIIDGLGSQCRAVETVGGRVLFFCDNGLYALPSDEMRGQPILLDSNVRCTAPHAVVKMSKGIAFYDGSGFSFTDGASVVSLTAFKCRDTMAAINFAAEKGIVGTYDRLNSRVIFAFPLNTDTQNNWGLYITEGSWNCYLFTRPDVRVLWSGYSQGEPMIYHGTSGDLTDGNGDIWRHDGATDGTDTGSAYVFNVDSVDGQVVTVTSQQGDASWQAGDHVTYYPAESGVYQEMILKAVTETGTNPHTYELEFADEYDLSSLNINDIILFGLIPFDYGVDWTDFTSPQYPHQPRAVHVDIEDFFGVLYCDFYTDLSDAPVQGKSFTVSPGESKIVFKYTGGKCYNFGYRLRGYSRNDFKIHSTQILWDTQV